MSLHLPDLMRSQDSHQSGVPSKPIARYTLAQIVNLNAKSVSETSQFIQNRIFAGAVEPTLGKQIIDPMNEVAAAEIQRIKKPQDHAPKVSINDYVDGFKSLDTESLLAKIERDIHPAVEDNVELYKETRNSLLRQSVVNALEVSVHNRSHETALLSLKVNESINSVLPVNAREALMAMHEMKMFGVDIVSEYYRATETIHQGRNGTEVEASIEDWHKAMDGKKIDGNIKRHVTARLLRIGEKKRNALREVTRINILKKNSLPVEKKAEIFMENFNKAVKDFDYYTPDQMKTILHGVPPAVLNIMFKGRKFISGLNKSIAAPPELCEGFWMDRVGRRKKYDEFQKREASVADDRDRSHYEKRIADKFLNSEAAGFEIEEKLSVKENMNASSLVLQSMKSLLQVHRPKGQDKVYFTLLMGENMMRKVWVATHDNISDEELMNNINAGIARSKNEMITSAQGKPLSMSERVTLSYTGYSPRRITDKNYRHVYGHSENKELIGDYLIQVKERGSVNINSLMEDQITEHDPESLFAVDSHKAAVLIDTRSRILDNTVKSVIRYNHTEFDGVQAERHAKYILDGLSNEMLPDAQSAITEGGFDSKPMPDGNIYPQFEGHATMTDESQYPKFILTLPGKSKPIKLSPSFTRSFVLALANDVDFYHHLHAGDKARSEFFEKYGDRFDDVQPVITSFNHLKEEFTKWKEYRSKPTIHDQKETQEWIIRFNNGKERAEQSHSDVAMYAAIPGQFEEAIYNVGLKTTGGVKMVKYPGSMFSPIVHLDRNDPDYARKLIFRTAQSDSYASQTIDLMNPEKSMGVVGYIQEGKSATYTCRKLPSQAQSEFRHRILIELLNIHTPAEIRYGTLREFTTILQSWDDLLKGKVNLNTFLDVRKKTFERLKDSEVCGEENLKKCDITDENSLQNFLNTTLTRAAQATLDKQKIAQTKKDLEAFMRDMGVHVE